MFAGHVGVALGIGHAERRVNIGVVIAAALLLDLLLWLLVLLGWESVTLPPNVARTQQFAFVFPYSHGLVASLVWSLGAGAVGAVLYGPLHAAKWRVAALLAGAVFSHWLLDALVHQPELPLAGASAPKVGLWQSMPVALVVETVIVVVGLGLFVRGSRLSRGKSLALAALTLLLLACTIGGMTIAPPPPSALTLASSSFVTLVVVCVLACWLGRPPRAR